MAKINHILFGQGKGKVGGLVLQRYEGMNVVREKPISVKNPQSTKQTEQRAKFKLASQITAEYIDVINARLSKLSIYTRMKRATAVNAILGVITNNEPDTPEALVGSVVSALNEKSASPVASPTITFNTTDNTFEITAQDGDVVIADILSHDDSGKVIAREVISYTSDGTKKTSDVISAETACAMVVALRATTENGRATITNIDFNGELWSNTINRSVAAGDLEVSNLGYAVMTP